MTMQQSLTRTLGRTGLVLKQHSPEILLTAGIIGGIAAAVLAARVTQKAREAVEEIKQEADAIVTAPDNVGTEQERNQELGMVYIRGGLKIAKLYAPAVGLGVLSITSLLASHNIMTHRQASLVAAYNAVSEAYAAYRRQVIAEQGEEEDLKYRNGSAYEEVIDSEDGQTTMIKVEGGHSGSPYAVLFDTSSREWRNDAQLNRFFLKSQQNAANDKLRAQGHLFLNEVHDMLGLPRTKAGAIVGWVANTNDNSVTSPDNEWEGDGFVDFDIENINNGPAKDFTRDGGRGWSKYIWLDFNVDGIIYDKI